jgi:hypothetical protein
MKAAIWIAVIVLLIMGAYKGCEFYEKHSIEQAEIAATLARRDVNPATLAGMDRGLEQLYKDAQAKGLPGLRDFLQSYRNTTYLTDPKLAWIELDYVVLQAARDPADARKVFQQVRSRLQPGSPVYWRMKDLEGSFR